MKKILFAASEAIPFIKTGGLADVAGSLPGYFNKGKYDVRIIIPKYLCMDQKFKGQLHFKCHFYTVLGWRKQYAGIFETKYDGVTYYLVDNEFYFAGDKPYNALHEDVEKFAFFSKAVLEALPFLDFWPDIIHCHDWQTGLIPVFLKTLYNGREHYAGIKTVYSIHNLKFQGRWNLAAVQDITGLPKQVFTADKLESYGEANYLKGGVVYADIITTVSKTYAHEITTVQGGEGLDGLMRVRSKDLYGIVNGIDYKEYDPQSDPYIYKNYDDYTMVGGKRENKIRLQGELGLSEDKDIFLLGMVSRLTYQKGLDIVADIMEELLRSERIQIAVLGMGEQRYEDMFLRFSEKYPGRIKAYIGYDDKLAHRIYAASDGFLMPSLFEPCGLSQLISMHYGTVPIVRETGGLKDTVEAYNEYEHTGTGFSFANFIAQELFGTIKYALHIFYKQRKDWNEMAASDMRRDYSWGKSAGSYEKIYDLLI